MFLLQEMDFNESFYKQFLEFQPSLENLPLLYTEMEKEFLNGTAFLEQLDTKLEFIEKDYLAIAKEIPEFKENYTLEQFVDAFAIAEFRDFTF